MEADVIDGLAGIAPGTPLDGLRDRRAQARIHSQASWRALFEPLDPSEMSIEERTALAAFVAGLHGDAAAVRFYGERLAKAPGPMAVSLAAAVQAEIDVAGASGPYGVFPAGPLTGEDVPGPVHQVGEKARAGLGPRLATAFEHAHMLVFHPRDADAESLQKMLEAGWSTTGIVTLSQLVAFLCYQIRVAAGLRALAGHPAIEGRA